MRQASIWLAAAASLVVSISAQVVPDQSWNKFLQLAAASAESGSCDAVCRAVSRPTSESRALIAGFCSPFLRLGASRQCADGFTSEAIAAGE
jgi:hypothetical protein